MGVSPPVDAFDSAQTWAMYQGVGRTQEVFLRHKVSTVRFIRFRDRGSPVGRLHSEILFWPSSKQSRPDWGLLPKSTEL
jgi:hypothetical protein